MYISDVIIIKAILIIIAIAMLMIVQRGAVSHDIIKLAESAIN